MSDNPGSTKQKFFGDRGLELKDAAEALARMFPIEPELWGIAGIETCDADDPDVAFHIRGADWSDFVSRLSAFQVSLSTFAEKVADVEPKIGALTAEIDRIKFWPEH